MNPNDVPTRRCLVFGLAAPFLVYPFFPKWHSVKYHYDYTVMQQLNYTYTKLRRNTIIFGGAAVIGSYVGYYTRNPAFD